MLKRKSQFAAVVDIDGEELIAHIPTTNRIGDVENKNLPVPHCIRGADGWEIRSEIRELLKDARIYEKPTFGSTALAADLKIIRETLIIYQHSSSWRFFRQMCLNFSKFLIMLIAVPKIRLYTTPAQKIAQSTFGGFGL